MRHICPPVIVGRWLGTGCLMIEVLLFRYDQYDLHWPQQWHHDNANNDMIPWLATVLASDHLRCLYHWSPALVTFRSIIPLCLISTIRFSLCNSRDSPIATIDNESLWIWHLFVTKSSPGFRCLPHYIAQHFVPEQCGSQDERHLYGFWWTHVPWSWILKIWRS